MLKTILLILLLLFIIIILSSVYVYIYYTDYMLIKVRFWFFRFDLNGKEAAKTVDEDVVNDENKDKLKSIIKARGVSGFIRLLKTIVDTSSLLLKKFLTTINIDNFSLKINVRAEDSASVAIKYGMTCTAIYPILGRLKSITKVKNSEVKITPNFHNPNNNDSDVIFKGEFHITIWRLFVIACFALKHYIKIKRSIVNE